MYVCMYVCVCVCICVRLVCVDWMLSGFGWVLGVCSGAPFLPYLITDKVVAPPHLHHCYSEHLALMPNCYFVNDYKRCHR